MYRLNQQGRFNVPFGGGERTTAPLWEYDLLTSSARALRGAKLLTVDFESALSTQRKATWYIAILRTQWRITTTGSSVITSGTSLGRIRNGFHVVAIQQQLAVRSSL